MRLTPERESEIRSASRTGSFSDRMVQDVLAELDAVRAELEAAKVVVDCAEGNCESADLRDALEAYYEIAGT